LKKDGLKMENVKVEQKKLLGRQVKAVAAAGLVALAPLVGTSCENVVTETQYVYPDITTHIRLLDGQIEVRCPGELLQDSLNKLNEAMILLDTELAIDLGRKVQVEAGLSKGVVIIMGSWDADNIHRDGDTILVGANWFKGASPSDRKDIFRNAIMDVGNDVNVTMIPMKQFNNAKENVRLSLGRFQMPQRQA
jgi:hypothetical protein